jgi:hypothetical protein
MGQQHFSPYGEEDVDHHPRRAALLLHALPQNDQHWLLAQLLPVQREMLGTLLLELRDLGIPADQAWLREVVSTTASPRKPDSVVDEVGTARPDSRQTALEQASAIMLAEVLRDEPVGVIARLLALQAWPWSDAFMEQLSTIKRRQVEDILARHNRGNGHPTVDSGSALRKQMVASVLRRLDECGVRSVRDPGVPRVTASFPVAFEGPWRQRLRHFVHRFGRSVLPTKIDR